MIKVSKKVCVGGVGGGLKGENKVNQEGGGKNCEIN